MRIIVFGGGVQGRVIARNLSERPERPVVEIGDIQKPQELPDNVSYRQVNVLDAQQVKAAASGADAAVLAVPSSIARQALSNLIESGVPVADVSFTPDPPLDLDDAARGKGACCVVDCGVAPGLSHILVGSAYKKLDGLDEIQILVGGVPIEPPAVFHHAVYFNPRDLIAEYIRPARARESGSDTGKAPLAVAVHQVEDTAGKFEAFLSDGLRTLLTSYPEIPDMWERTLRWPGHIETMKVLSELGLLEQADTADTTADTIEKKFPGRLHPDFLLMKVICRKGARRLGWRLHDKMTDGHSAMSRTTGYTTAAIAMLLARRQFTEPGVHAPEKLGEHEHLTRAILDDVNAHGLNVETMAEIC